MNEARGERAAVGARGEAGVLAGSGWEEAKSGGGGGRGRERARGAGRGSAGVVRGEARRGCEREPWRLCRSFLCRCLLRCLRPPRLLRNPEEPPTGPRNQDWGICAERGTESKRPSPRPPGVEVGG